MKARNQILIGVCLLTTSIALSQPVNDQCSGAIEITPSTACNAITTDFTDATLGEGSCSCIECGFGSGLDLWYRIVAPQDGSLEVIDLTGSSFPGGVIVQLYSNCEPFILDACDTINPTQSATFLTTTGEYYIRMISLPFGFEQFCVTFTPNNGGSCPIIDPVENITTCNSYTLPPITGTNLSSDPQYYSQPNGGGSAYAPGDQITSTGLYYVYDSNNGCSDEEPFEVSVITANELSFLTTCTTTDLDFSNSSGIVFAGCQSFDGDYWYSVYLAQSTELDILLTSCVLAIYDEAISLNNRIHCLSALDNQIISLDAGHYCFQFSGASFVTGTFCISANCTNSPEIDPYTPVEFCNQYTLPSITGSNLSGNEAYYSESGGNGIQYAPGDVVTTEGTYYAFDQNNGCSSEVELVLTQNLGQVKTRTSSFNTNWNAPNGWDPSGLPSICDDVIIPAPGFGGTITCEVSDQGICNTLSIELGAVFEVKLGGVFEVGEN